jgi:hypothetical protein
MPWIFGYTGFWSYILCCKIVTIVFGSEKDVQVRNKFELGRQQKMKIKDQAGNGTWEIKSSMMYLQMSVTVVVSSKLLSLKIWTLIYKLTLAIVLKMMR